jgi:hypothetical protein
MAKKDMKICSPFLTIKEIHIKITLIPPHPLELLPSRTPRTTNAGKDVRKRNPYTLLVGM